MSKHFPYPYLRFSCRVQNRRFNAEAFVDTGYDGGLVIPESERIGMPSPLTAIPIELGDGRRIFAGVYAGTVMLEDERFQVTVLFLGNEYLIGREVVDQLRLCFHRGQYLEIEE